MEEEMSIELANGDTFDAPTILSKLIRLKQIAVTPKLLDDSLPFDNAKFKFLLDLLEGTEEKIVVFSQFAQAVKQFATELRKLGYSVVEYIGEMSTEEREHSIEQFQNGNARIFIATLQAGGVGITLTASNIAVFLDKHWTPAINEQAQDRLYRIGQKNNVMIYELIAKDTIEEYIEELLDEKKDVIKAVLEKYRPQML
jgi:SNF2 family DNA or RNA helicase